MLFRRDDWTLFRNLDTLGQKAGVPRDRLAALVVKEIVDNALDAGAKCDVKMARDGTIFVFDDGPGIPGTDAEIATLFSINRPLTSSKLLRLPTRGALGNGLRVVAGAVLATGGELTVTTRGRTLRLTPQDGDGSTLVQRVSLEKGVRTLSGEPITFDPARGGTLVALRLGLSLNPMTHWSGHGDPGKNVLSMARLAISMRGESWFTGRTSPHWYTSDAFFELVSAAGNVEVGDLVKLLDGNVKPIPALWHTCAAAVPREHADALLKHLRDNVKPPKPQKLGVVGARAVPHAHGYACKKGTYFLQSARGVYGADIPTVVEVWVRRLEKDDEPEATILVNRTPITAKIGCWKYGGGNEGKVAISGCGLNHHFKTGKTPVSITVCVTSPYMPITTDGKEPNLRPLLGLINDAIVSAARKARVTTAASREREGGVSLKDMIFEVIDEAIRTASGEGRHRFSLRQLFYKTRPLLQDLGYEEELKYKYFADVVGDYERRIGQDVPGMYRDARGALQHPHEIGQIPLGTLNVERYKRPAYKFNKVLYIEKGGFMPLLADAKWGERHDCAILTSQGMATRAVRDLLDMLGDSEEELEFFCIHDSDGPGTIIHQALVEGTKARPGRRVKVTNLGLDPWEAAEMGLESETFEREKGEVAVADYVYTYDVQNGTTWAKWLQTHRVELNAMSSPQFLEWLDRKIEEHSQNTKVVPPPAVLIDRYTSRARTVIREALVEEAIRNLNIDARTDILLSTIKNTPDAAEIRTALAASPIDSWEHPLERAAIAAAKKALNNQGESST